MLLLVKLYIFGKIINIFMYGGAYESNERLNIRVEIELLHNSVAIFHKFIEHIGYT